MTTIVDGKLITNELCQNSRGGTEMMIERLLKYVDVSLLQGTQIHVSRPAKNQFYSDKKQVLYLHDLAQDPENKILQDGGWKKFDYFVFVSQWQRDTYIMAYGIPYSMCKVIPNAIEKEYKPRQKLTDKIRFIYHTTPHRGLELVYPIFDALSTQYDNIHLDVYSSFAVYGWEQRDKQFQSLFDKINEHEMMTYHGAVSNQQVLDALDQSHIFLYPSIWQETSCIALIEAIRSGIICIHPNYGALSETAANSTVMYDYTDNVQDHLNLAYLVTRGVVDQINNNDNLFQSFTTSDKFMLLPNTINNFVQNWNSILKAMVDGK